MLVGETISESAAATEALGRRLGAALAAPVVCLLHGELGSGKTVLARGLLRGLGVTGPVRSPSFTLAIPYAGRLPVVHADLYRLESAAAVESLAWDDWLAAGVVLVVEWGERARALLGDGGLSVTLRHLGGDRRSIRLEAGADARAAARALAAAWAGEQGRRRAGSGTRNGD